MLQHLWTGPISNTAVDVVQMLPGVGTSWCGCFLVRVLPGAGTSWCGYFLVRVLPGAGTAWCGYCLVRVLPGAGTSWCCLVLPGAAWCCLMRACTTDAPLVCLHSEILASLSTTPPSSPFPLQGGKSVGAACGGSKGAAMEKVLGEMGGKSVEVRPVGVSKGAAMERVLGEIVHQKPLPCPFDFVMTVGHFLSRDEDIYQFFEPDLPHDNNMPPGMDGYQQSMDGTMGPMDGNCGVSMDGNMVAMGHAHAGRDGAASPAAAAAAATAAAAAAAAAATSAAATGASVAAGPSSPSPSFSAAAALSDAGPRPHTPDSVTARSSRLKAESRGGGSTDGDAVGSEGRAALAGAGAGAGAGGVGGSSSGRSRGGGLGGFRWKGSKKSEKKSAFSFSSPSLVSLLGSALEGATGSPRKTGMGRSSSGGRGEAELCSPAASNAAGAQGVGNGSGRREEANGAR
ncbi:unnamed protein product [Closterium sp. NIES-54]